MSESPNSGEPIVGKKAPGRAQQLLAQALVQLATTRRTFTEGEALQDIWNAGYDVNHNHAGFVLALEATEQHERHWRLRDHTLANDRLFEALNNGTWDGRDIDGMLAKIDGEDGVHAIFCPVDPRFKQHADGRYDLADREPEIALSASMQASLNKFAPALLAHWQAQGAFPWTVQQIMKALEELGWSERKENASWMQVRAWLKSWSEVVRAGQDYWVIAGQLPQPFTSKPLRVLPVNSSQGSYVSIEGTAHASYDEQANIVPDRRVTFSPVPRSSSLLDPSSGSITSWTVVLRTRNITQGFLNVPASARSAYPGQSSGEGNVIVLHGKWFDSDTDLWLWLDRAQHILYGADLAEQLGWCPTGQKLHVDWAPERLVIRSVDVDTEVQKEERRLIDVEELAQLRGGLGESYRRSLQAILIEEPGGLLFKELVLRLRERQNHQVHRGTIRALLSAGGFVQQADRWYLAPNAEKSERQLRAALVETLVATEGGDFTQSLDTHQNLRTTAEAITTRLRELIEILQAPS
jgi:hypothetical protein